MEAQNSIPATNNPKYLGVKKLFQMVDAPIADADVDVAATSVKQAKAELKIVLPTKYSLDDRLVPNA